MASTNLVSLLHTTTQVRPFFTPVPWYRRVLLIGTMVMQICHNVQPGHEYPVRNDV